MNGELIRCATPRAEAADVDLSFRIAGRKPEGENRGREQ